MGAVAEGRGETTAARVTAAVAVALFLLVPLGWWPKDLYGLIKWVMVFAAAIAIAAMWGVTALLAGGVTVRRNALNLPLALILAWSSLSFVTGPPRYYVVGRYGELLALVVLYGALATSLRTRQRRAAVAVGALAGLMLISCLGIAQRAGYFPIDSPWGTGLGKRVYATMLNPIYLADFIISLFPMALALWTCDARGRPAAALCAMVIAASTLCLLFTVSWGALLGWIISAILFIRLTGSRCAVLLRRGRLYGILGACAVAAGIFFALHRSIAASDTVGFQNRIFYWRASLGMIAERPVTGFGLNSFQPQIPYYLTRVITADLKEGMPEEKKPAILYEGVFAHNEYLAVWIELGLVGVLLYIWLFVRVFAQASRNLSPGQDPLETSLQTGAICGLSAVLVESVFNYPLRVPASMVSSALFFAYIGSGASTREGYIDCSWIPRPVRIAAAAALLGATVCLIPLVARQLTGERLYVEGRYAWYAGKWDTVRERCREAFTYSLTEPEAYDLMGEAEERRGALAAAVNTYAMKLFLKPHDLHALTRLGIVYDRLGMEGRAREHFAAAVTLERHDSADARVRMAGLLLKQGDARGARALLEGGMSLHRSDPMLRNALGISRAADGDTEGAAAEFREAALRGGGIPPRYNLRILEQAARAKARPRPEAFIAPAGSDWIQQRLERGRAALKAGRLADAEGEFQAVLARYPDYVPALSAMGICHIRSRRLDAAMKSWERARAVDPDYRVELP
ncbi:MAG: tetratricopeptide repeat protein [Candidatus Aureabacteria bacterium]|nr:tetratricopeptide repeat protein [Candidatus Auribacterota bacterium]